MVVPYLPTELWLIITQDSDLLTLTSLSLTCHRLNAALKDSMYIRAVDMRLGASTISHLLNHSRVPPTVSTVKRILELGVNIDTSRVLRLPFPMSSLPTQYSWFPGATMNMLCFAANAGNEEAVSLLLELGANPDSRVPYQRIAPSPIHIAILRRHAGIFEKLLEAALTRLDPEEQSRHWVHSGEPLAMTERIYRETIHTGWVVGARIVLEKLDGRDLPWRNKSLVSVSDLIQAIRKGDSEMVYFLCELAKQLKLFQEVHMKQLSIEGLRKSMLMWEDADWDSRQLTLEMFLSCVTKEWPRSKRWNWQVRRWLKGRRDRYRIALALM
ncbi:hypothetical protein EDC01DRAFT_664384 [Geopyxis carbonaria]|nr:hypothetical protein EDC01DRAFT_664384 [Geopyxis carbonaria]